MTSRASVGPALIAASVTMTIAGAQTEADVWLAAPPQWVSPVRVEAWNALTRAFGEHRARWNPAAGTPTEVFGKGIPVDRTALLDLESAQRAALRLLEERAALVGHDGDQWLPLIARRVGPLVILVFQQHRNSLPVIGGRADVRIHATGKVSMFGAASFDVERPGNPWPDLTPEEAVTAACSELSIRSLLPLTLQLQPPPCRLVYWADARAKRLEPARLCWEVTIDAIGDKLVGRAYVDARTGRLRGYESDLSYCSGGHVHVRGFHPALRSRPPDIPAAQPMPAGLAASGAPVDSPLLVPVTGIVSAVIPILHEPGDLTNGTTRAATLHSVPIRGVRVTIPSTGAFAFTDPTGAFTIAHTGTAPVGVVAQLLDAERFRAILPQTGSIVQASATAIPGTTLTLSLGTVAGITESELGQTTAAYYFDSVSRYIEGFVGPLPPRAFHLLGAVAAPQVCNAFYTSQSDAITFFASPRSQNIQVNSTTVPCKDDTYTAFSNVIQHEYGHFVDDLFGGESFFEGMSEGWGDVLAMYHAGTEFVNNKFYNPMAVPAHDWARKGTNNQTWNNWAASGSTGCDYPTGMPPAIEVHCQGESWMGFAWKVRSNFIGSIGSGHPHAFSDVDAAVSHAETIVLGSMVANAADQNGALLQVYLLDDDDADLTNGSPHDFFMNMAANVHSLVVPTSNNGIAGFLTYGAGCDGVRGISIEAAATPRIGTMFVVAGRNCPPAAPAALLFGFSSGSWLGIPLPIDLSPLGATNCRLHCSPDFVVPGRTDDRGVSIAGIPVPYDPLLVGQSFFTQWFVVDSTANAAGWVVGHAARGVWSR